MCIRDSLRSDLRDSVLLSGGRVSVTYQSVFVGIGGFADEDVYPANRDYGELDGVCPSRNPALILRDDRKVAGVQDAPHGDRVADACKGGTRPVPASRCRWPHGGRQLSLPIRQYPRGDILTKGEEDGAKGRRAIGTVVRDLPSFGTPAR